MTGGGGVGGDSYMNFSTGRAGPHGSSANGGPGTPRPPGGGIVFTLVVVTVGLAILALAGVLLAVFAF